MKGIAVVSLIILLLVLLTIWQYKQVEELEPVRSTGLIDPMQLAATVFRSSNTILTSVGVFSDKMDSLPLPDEIKDGYNEWIEKGFISPVKDQMLCGGCWAFATCGTLADRLTIVTNGGWYPKYGLSEQILISCGDEFNMDFYQGCEGGIPQFAIEALTSNGVPADTACKSCAKVDPVDPQQGGETKRSGGVVNPNDAGTCAAGGSVYASTDFTYFQTGCDGTTSCNLTNASTCPCETVQKELEKINADNAAILYKTVGEAHSYTSHGEGDNLGTVDLWPNIPPNIIEQNVIRMKKALYYEGPLTIGYRVTQDFYTYWPTVTSDNYYRYDGKSAMAGGHAVCIVGWKTTSDGTPVWICKNSWGVNGGYGFDSPTIIDPDTGDTIPKYRGGFWNHIMGENDSFVESNAIGAYPDIHNPEISRYLPNNGSDLPKEWFDTMTLRDIYESAKGVTPLPKPTPETDKPKPETDKPTPETDKPTPETDKPTPETDKPKRVSISSDNFEVVNMTPVNSSSQSIRQFFLESTSRYIIAGETVEDVQAVVNILSIQEKSSKDDMINLATELESITNGYIIIGTKGEYNNYYYLVGFPQDWKNNTLKTFLRKAATVTKFSMDIEYQLGMLPSTAPVVHLSKK